MVAILNITTLSLDKSKLQDYPLYIKNDPELTPRMRDFELAVFQLAVEQNTASPLGSDEALAKRMNLKDGRGIRRYTKKAIDLGKMIKLKAEEKGHYRLGFLHDQNNSLMGNDSLSLEEIIEPKLIFDSLAENNPSQLAKKSTPKAKVKKSGKDLPKTSIEQTSPQELSLPTTTLAAQQETKELPQVTWTQVSPIAIAITNAPTDIPPTQPGAASTPTPSQTSPKEVSMATPRVSVFATALLAKQEQDRLNSQAQELFYDLNEEQEEMLVELTILIEESWERTNELLELKRTWKQSKLRQPWENFLSERADEQARLEARKQFLLLDNHNVSSSNKTLAIQNAIEYWSKDQATSNTQPTNDQLLVKVYQNDHNTTKQNDHDHENTPNAPKQNLVKVYQKQHPANTQETSDQSQTKRGFSSIQSVALSLEVASTCSINTNKPNNLANFGKLLPKLYLEKETTSNNFMDNSNSTNSSLPSSTALPQTHTTNSALYRVRSTTPQPSTYPFKALKAYSYSHDLNLKDLEKSLSLRVGIRFGTNSTGSNSNSNPSTSSTTEGNIKTITNSTNQNNAKSSNNNNARIDSNEITNKFKEQQKTAEGVIYNRTDTVNLPNPKCKYCLGKGNLFKLTGTGVDDVKETLCICSKIYMLQPLITERNMVLVGTPNLSAKELALQKELISQFDEQEVANKAKVISMSDKIKTTSNQNRVQNQAENQTGNGSEISSKNNSSGNFTAKTSNKLEKGFKENKPIYSKTVSAEKTKVAPSDVKTNSNAEEQGTEIPARLLPERMTVRKEEFAFIDQLNQTANSRVNDKGKPDVKITLTKDGKYWIIPNPFPFKQERKSTVSFWDWLLYAVRQPNRKQPVRLACSRYYLGDKDEEIQDWLKERANLAVGGTISSVDGLTDKEEITNNLVVDNDNFTSNENLQLTDIISFSDTLSQLIADVVVPKDMLGITY